MKKRCSICGEEKELEDFRKSPQCRNGRAGWCKKCGTAYTTSYKQKHSEHLAALRRKRYAETKGVEVKEREQRRKDRAPLLVQCQRMRYGMLAAHRKYGIIFESNILTSGYLVNRINSNPFCEACGTALAIGVNDIRAKVTCQGINGIMRQNAPSIDRIIPSAGYIKDNIAILCWRCNRIKCDATPKELQCIANWLVNRTSYGNEVQ